MPCHGTQELSISRCEGRGDCSDPPRYYRRLNRWARSLGPPKYPTLALEISPRTTPGRQSAQAEYVWHLCIPRSVVQQCGTLHTTTDIDSVICTCSQHF